VELVEGAVESGREWAELSAAEHNAWRWLVASGLDDTDKLEGYKSRRPLFELPGDPGNLVRCGCCVRVLVDPLSKAVGKGKAKVAYVHARARQEGENLRRLVEDKVEVVESLIAELSPALLSRAALGRQSCVITRWKHS
jgi:hypothetical protein